MGVNRSYQRRSSYPSGSTLDHSTSSSNQNSDSGNPDPKNYILIRVEQIGKFLLIKLKYPDCTNYEGEKILVFKDVDLVTLINQHNIDPHFSNTSKFKHPIVRFVPTDEGWEMATRFIEMENNG